MLHRWPTQHTSNLDTTPAEAAVATATATATASAVSFSSNSIDNEQVSASSQEGTSGLREYSRKYKRALEGHYRITSMLRRWVVPVTDVFGKGTGCSDERLYHGTWYPEDRYVGTTIQFRSAIWWTTGFRRATTIRHACFTFFFHHSPTTR